MILVDTNIFLEILLSQNKKEKCKLYLENNAGNTCISDFSLHSIGVYFFREKKLEIFDYFVADVLPQNSIFYLNKKNYESLTKNSRRYNLDFDDPYQTTLAEECGMKIVTMDKDFQKVKNDIEVEFI